MRGNQLSGLRVGHGHGSIPARAGEPLRIQPITGARGVYPRACGGTILPQHFVFLLQGLSPRVRGNRADHAGPLAALRSIPARAGEPPMVAVTEAINEVYPRACGGTWQSRMGRRLLHGLSPRVRGNPAGDLDLPVVAGSIPARAGEPTSLRWNCGVVMVYPRACGGTFSAGIAALLYYGLSPRVRGNLGDVGDRLLGGRSIPARAGEPHFHSPRRPGWTVYPRACGGTFQRGSLSGSSRGLSPRVRGNPQGGQRRRGRPRSIPARAGEPAEITGLTNGEEVYPRACGGTWHWQSRKRRWRGLSPRVRGNRNRDDHLAGRSGSIPARAGEPS